MSSATPGCSASFSRKLSSDSARYLVASRRSEGPGSAPLGMPTSPAPQAAASSTSVRKRSTVCLRSAASGLERLRFSAVSVGIVQTVSAVPRAFARSRRRLRLAADLSAPTSIRP